MNAAPPVGMTGTSSLREADLGSRVAFSVEGFAHGEFTDQRLDHFEALAIGKMV
ncbi:hypothetical protein GCM10007881_50040 [Mesorhizobium huakuii]|nr:hypothetical protein GCM10007881_50040 [Mesorhizobium huakuii]